MNKKIIAKRLKDFRGGKNRENVAELLGISISALQMYETAQRIPQDDIKLKIAKLYGVSVQEIFFSEQEYNMCPK
ncbi:helix-turn-helix transcriptional regulator [Lentibacillus amyloliquefaciens]|uniref:XRE family transcriptional regulator n=1 Tax=Lentibacillus amyloliquefaciens TaxID=1472767 RepID=A0A0U4FAT7_9BACI|nr:helix-turn-helix transcriptional regulator [Lentibacillus amyloliquefaciens]ALX47613.1 XRE family transcriptional regulator [Lentibacillus amyloliquefaciens]